MLQSNIYKFAASVILICCIVNSSSAQWVNHLAFSAKLTGNQEVPPVNSNGRGIAGFVLSEDMDSLWIFAAGSGLTGPIQGAHIHESKAGTTGGVLQSLDIMQVGNRFYGVLGGPDLNISMISKMLRGETYINFHTTQNPNGEIRGQIMPEKDLHFYAEMKGANEVPAVTSNAYGMAVVRLSQDRTRLQLHAIFNDLSSAVTGAHLHLAPAGKNGGVIINLMPYLTGNRIDAEIQVGAALDQAIDSLLDGKVYINVHTTNNSGGEIRGQLMMDNGLSWISMLNGGQEVPAVNTTAYGLGYFSVNADMDTLKYHVIFSNLSSAATNAHLHKGKPGESGGAVFGLKDSMSGNVIKGTAYGNTLSKGLIMDMLQGRVYVNVHTSNNTGGEIRGQLIPDIRDAYVYELCPRQEGGAVNSKAWGIGIASADTMMRSIHFMAVVDSLGSAITGAHFHKAAMGQNGGVVFNMLNAYSFNGNVIDGYWSDTSSTSLTASLVNDLKAGNIYMNVHTDNYPNGELRGQVINGALCTELVGIKHAKIRAINAAVYPNPFSDILMVDISSAKNGSCTINLFDATGKQVFAENVRLNAGNNSVKLPALQGASGLYMLQVNHENGSSFSKKIMKY